MSCTNCFEALIQSCSDVIIKAALPANYPVYWRINKASGNKIYQKLVNAASNGDITIAKADLPDGFLNSYAGPFNIELRDGNNYLNNIAVFFDGVQYTCIQFDVKEFSKPADDDSPTNVIESLGEIVLSGGGTSDGATPYPFFDTSTVTIDHGLGRLVIVQIYDLSGNELQGVVTQPDLNTVNVVFNQNETGRVLIL